MLVGMVLVVFTIREIPNGWFRVRVDDSRGMMALNVVDVKYWWFGTFFPGESMVNLWFIIGITIYLLGGLEPWNFMTFPSCWECHNPN